MKTLKKTLKKTKSVNEQLAEITKKKLQTVKKLHACLEEINIPSEIKTKSSGGKYLRLKCPCNGGLIVEKKNGIWKWKCADNECHKRGHYDNLAGLVRLFKPITPFEACSLLKNTLYTADGKEFGDMTLDFGKHRFKTFDQINEIDLQYLLWLYQNPKIVDEETHQKLGAFIWGQ
ncbi:MAG: hypothetical protein GXP26_17140 [Planctomycetes bacterium]|nr:hypothetical protein [Planctomycetota bacterium]